MIMDFYDEDDHPYTPRHVKLLYGTAVIQEVGAADIHGGSFLSKSFILFGGTVATCVTSVLAGAKIFAYIKLDY